MRKLFLDLDGVIIDTNKYIKEAISNSGIDISVKESFIELCKSFPWNNFLYNCEPINNSFEVINELNKKYDLTIITHCYSYLEEELKIDFIKRNLNDIKYVTVPYEKMKNEVVLAENCILVDDYYVNIENWNSSGGIGLYFSTQSNEKNCLTIDNLIYLLDSNFIEGIGI